MGPLAPLSTPSSNSCSEGRQSGGMCAAKAAMVVGTSFSRRSLRRAPSLRKSASVGICHSHNGSGEPSCIWQPVGRGEWTMTGTSSGFGGQGNEGATFYRKLPRRASLLETLFRGTGRLSQRLWDLYPNTMRKRRSSPEKNYKAADKTPGYRGTFAGIESNSAALEHFNFEMLDCEAAE